MIAVKLADMKLNSFESYIYFFSIFYLQNKRQEHTLSTLNNSNEKSNKNSKKVLRKKVK